MSDGARESVTIVIPNFNGWELLERGLPGLLGALETHGAGDRVVVVDNASGDESVARLRSDFPEVAVVTLPENLGFGPAVDQGIRGAATRLVMSLNNDVEVEAGFLDPLVEAMQAPDVFAVTPRVRIPSRGDRIESLTRGEFRGGLFRFRQPSLETLETGDREFEDSQPVFFAVGGTILLDRGKYESLGGFDPLFRPFYWEDIDLCYRAWRAGWRVLYEPRSRVVHRHRGTIGRYVDDEAVEVALLKNQILFTWKNLDDPELRGRHGDALAAALAAAHLGGDRRFLLALSLALEQWDEACRARASRPAPANGAPRGDREVLEVIGVRETDRLPSIPGARPPRDQPREQEKDS